MLFFFFSLCFCGIKVIQEGAVAASLWCGPLPAHIHPANSAGSTGMRARNCQVSALLELSAYWGRG